eukprot:CAMPEP_0178378528 /NCGR_PEP_ID=MMETSP0689_2-20121128/4475_1 /TAXON_ID=160604 /ORGANISM="Amphidinium massartii, Strain CS-259" /LENGTH=1026 /DNA_ID=CAMNT_0019998605 /DNA_START=10 /DNA_END=3090 /DNA_ORIENTATION=-
MARLPKLNNSKVSGVLLLAALVVATQGARPSLKLDVHAAANGSIDDNAHLDDDDDDPCAKDVDLDLGLEFQPDESDLDLKRGDSDGLEELAKTKDDTSGFWHWAAGLPHRVANFGRMIIKKRAVKIELDKHKAIEMIEAAHGRVVFTVPALCYDELLQYLKTMSDTLEMSEEDLYRNRKMLRLFIKNTVTTGCAQSNAPSPEGHHAAQRMQPLYYGFWLLERKNDLEKKVVAVNVDLFRWRRYKKSGYKSAPNHQIWYYTRWHLSNILSSQLRYQLYEHPPLLSDGRYDEEGKTKLRKMIRRTARAASMMYGNLVAVSIGKKCYKIWLDGRLIEDTLSALHRATKPRIVGSDVVGPPPGLDDLKITLYFRERFYTGAGKGLWNAVRHPFRTPAKWWDRKKNNFNQAGALGKVMVVLSPLLKTAAVAGIVLGVVTAGQSTLMTIIVDAISTSLGESFAAQRTFWIGWVWDTILQQTVVRPMEQELMIQLEGTQLMNDLYQKLGFLAEVDSLRIKMEDAVEMLLGNPEIAELLDASPDPPPGFYNPMQHDPINVEETSKRYLRHFVGEAAAQELVKGTLDGILLRMREKQRQELQKLCCFLPYYKWRKYRHGTDSKEMMNKVIYYEGTMDPAPFTGKGKVVERTGRWFGRATKIEVKLEDSDDEDTVEVTLTPKVKAGLFVQDFFAHDMVNNGGDWLTWDNWVKYRAEGSYSEGIILLTKEQAYLRINPNYLKAADVEDGPCTAKLFTDYCTRHLVSETDEAGTGKYTPAQAVADPLWGEYKWFGLTPWRKYFDGVKIRLETGYLCNIYFNPDVSRCLLVKDAYLVDLQEKSEVDLDSMDDSGLDSLEPWDDEFDTSEDMVDLDPDQRSSSLDVVGDDSKVLDTSDMISEVVDFEPPRISVSSGVSRISVKLPAPYSSIGKGDKPLPPPLRERAPPPTEDVTEELLTVGLIKGKEPIQQATEMNKRLVDVTSKPSATFQSMQSFKYLDEFDEDIDDPSLEHQVQEFMDAGFELITDNPDLKPRFRITL